MILLILILTVSLLLIDDELYFIDFTLYSRDSSSIEFCVIHYEGIDHDFLRALFSIYMCDTMELRNDAWEGLVIVYVNILFFEFKPLKLQI